jgi:hypothetical protein
LYNTGTPAFYIGNTIRDSVVGIATRYRLVGPGIESREGGEIFRTRPDRPWRPPGLLYNGYRASFPEVKRPGRGVDHPPSSSARVKERVELYLYSPSGPSWPVLGRTLPYLYLYLMNRKAINAVTYSAGMHPHRCACSRILR